MTIEQKRRKIQELALQLLAIGTVMLSTYILRENLANWLINAENRAIFIAMTESTLVFSVVTFSFGLAFLGVTTEELKESLEKYSKISE